MVDALKLLNEMEGVCFFGLFFGGFGFLFGRRLHGEIQRDGEMNGIGVHDMKLKNNQKVKKKRKFFFLILSVH